MVLPIESLDEFFPVCVNLVIGSQLKAWQSDKDMVIHPLD